MNTTPVISRSTRAAASVRHGFEDIDCPYMMPEPAAKRVTPDDAASGQLVKRDDITPVVRIAVDHPAPLMDIGHICGLEHRDRLVPAVNVAHRHAVPAQIIPSHPACAVPCEVLFDREN